MTEFEPPPEALLIERLRQQLPDKQGSVSHLSRQAEISEGRWRQIVKGYQQANKETRVRVVAPAGTLARMAAAVSATPEDLEKAGREDAAVQLRKLQTRPHEPAQPSSPHWLDSLSTRDIIEQIRVLFAEVRRRIPTNGPSVDQPQDWPQPFFEGVSDEPPAVRRGQNGEHRDQFGSS